MIRNILITTALAVSMGAVAMPHGMGAKAPAPATTTAYTWHNTVHPVPPGSDSRLRTEGSTSAQPSQSSDVEPWHNTVHPVPPGSDPELRAHEPDKQSSGAQYTWHNTVQPVPPGSDVNTNAKTRLWTHSGAHHKVAMRDCLNTRKCTRHAAGNGSR